MAKKIMIADMAHEAEYLAHRLEFMADTGDMGRKPDPSCDKRKAATLLRAMAKALTA